MQEIDFNYVISLLEKEIKSLEEDIASDHDKDASLCRTLATLVLHDKRELLGLIKKAVRTERDKIQSAKDSIDATLLTCMAQSHSPVKWFTEEFKEKMENAIRRDAPSPNHPLERIECINMAKKLENMRLRNKSRKRESREEEVRYVQQDTILASAVKLLEECAKQRLKEDYCRQIRVLPKGLNETTSECCIKARKLEDMSIQIKAEARECKTDEEKIKLKRLEEALASTANLLRRCFEIMVECSL